MRKISDDKVRKLLWLIADARGYANFRLQEAFEGMQIRVDQMEELLYEILGEPRQKHKDCAHVCPSHPDVPAK